MWVYNQSNGHLIAFDASLAGVGYAGNGEGKNNPAMQQVHDVGPLPCGGYTIGAPIEHTTKGPDALPLTPDATNLMLGRFAFFIHGERIEPPPGLASDGCIILDREIRMLVWSSGDHRLRVVSGLLENPNS